jgi:hypothetical protein
MDFWVMHLTPYIMSQDEWPRQGKRNSHATSSAIKISYLEDHGYFMICGTEFFAT